MMNLTSTKIKPVRQQYPIVSNALLNWLPRWQSNDDINNLGIVNFLFDLVHINERMGYPPFIKDFNVKYGVAQWAREALTDFFIWEPNMPKERRCFVYNTYRDGSKTTWFSYILPLYVTLVGQYGIYYNDVLIPEIDYIVLKGKNARESKKKLLFLSSMLNKPIIKELFGSIKPNYKAVKDKEGKDEAGLLIMSNGYIWEAAGMGQPIRGFNLYGLRPKLIDYDDAENKDNTKSEERRKDNANEVMKEAFGALHDYGSLLYIGNKIHKDDTIGKLLDEKNVNWRKKVFTITVKVDSDGKRYPGIGNLDIEVPEWSARWTIDQIKERKQWFETQPDLGGLAGFLAEYYNIIKSDIDVTVRYHNATYFRQFGINWLKFNTPQGEKFVNVNIVVGCDPAISGKKMSSDAVITAIAIAPDKRRYVLEVSAGKYDQHDRFYDESMRPKIIALTDKDMMNVKRKGSCEEVVRLYLRYNAYGFVLETAGQQMGFYNDTMELFKRLDIIPISMPYVPHLDKITKLRNNPLNYFEQDYYYIRDNMTELKSEIDTFPHSKLDILDSIHLAEQLLFAPNPIEYSPIDLAIMNNSPNHAGINFPKTKQDLEEWIVY